jgi:hypothetical protein
LLYLEYEQRDADTYQDASPAQHRIAASANVYEYATANRDADYGCAG